MEVERGGNKKEKKEKKGKSKSKAAASKKEKGKKGKSELVFGDSDELDGPFLERYEPEGIHKTVLEFKKRLDQGTYTIKH